VLYRVAKTQIKLPGHAVSEIASVARRAVAGRAVGGKSVYDES